ncbi:MULTISPECIES: tautomerase family protein [unclassified Streptomyces]|uniref:tautomerase family protein n=1 Tax=unclassified Streptomyces TaxID=2593676 RepID=UPI0035DC7CBD
MDISYYNREFTDEQKERLGRALADVVVEHFSTYDGAVSVSLHPVDQEDWTEQVFEPRITGQKDRLIKAPDYRSE